MAKARFMSMRWLRLHIKEIIWATVILFVLSCFIIAAGTSRAQRNVDDKRKRAEDAEDRAKQADEAKVPPSLVSKMHFPALQISFPTTTASVSRVIDVKSLFQTLVTSDEYKKILNYPPQLRQAFGAQIKENILEAIVGKTLVELYAESNNIKPAISVQALVERDKAQITPAEFDRRLRKEKISVSEYGALRLQQEVMQTVFQTVSKAVPPTTASDEYLKKFYDEHKLRYKKDDEVTFKQLLLTPSDFREKVQVSDVEVKEYYDKHRADFMSSKRASVRHIFIDPTNPEFLKNISVEDNEARQFYSEKVNTYKKTEQVKARHILIKPKTSFEKTLDSFSINLRDFASKEGEKDTVTYTFDLGISEQKTDFQLKNEDVVLVTADQKKHPLTPENQKKVENSITLPVSGSPKSAIYGKCCFVLPKDAVPATLEIKDVRSTHSFDISGAHDEAKAFETAKTECEKVMARLNDGADFAKVASEISDDIGSRIKGGDLGAFSRGQMVKPFEDAAFEAKVNEIKGPVKTKYGYHIIKVEEHIAPRTLGFEEVREDILKELKTLRAAAKAETTLDSCRDHAEQKSRTFKEMVAEHSMAPSRKDEGRVPVFFQGTVTDDYTPDQKKALGEIMDKEQTKINEEIEEAIYKLNPMEVSPVLKTADGYHLFQLESFLDPIQLGFTPTVTEKIKEILGEKKRKEMAGEKAAEIAKKITPENFAALASETTTAGAAEFKDLPFSTDSSFNSYSLTQGMGQISMDGRTYLPKVQEALAGLMATAEKGAGVPQKVLGPIETELGYHFLLVSTVSKDQYRSFEDVKEYMKEMLTQEPNEKSISQEFEKNKDKFDKPATRKIRQIVVAEEEAAKDMHKRLMDGEIFSLLAQKYSIDGSSVNGGSIGPVKKGQLPAALEEKLWTLKKGEFTPPVQVSYGWVICLLEEDEAPGQKASLTPEVTDMIKKRLKQQLQNDLFESFLGELKRKSRIVRYPVVAEL